MSIEEQKIGEGVRAGNEVYPGGDSEGGTEIGGPLGPELERRARHGMAKRKPSGVERLAGGSPLQRVRRGPGRTGNATASPTAIDGIAHNWMPGVLEMNPNLVGPTGVQLEP
jgi:hypothetical protein